MIRRRDLPRVSPELLKASEQSSQRLQDAVADLLAAVDGYLPGEDAFHREMVDLIDADKNVVELMTKRKQA